MLQTRTLTMGSDHYSNGTHKIRLANPKAGYLVEIILLLFHAIKSRFVFYSLSWRQPTNKQTNKQTNKKPVLPMEECATLHTKPPQCSIRRR